MILVLTCGCGRESDDPAFIDWAARNAVAVETLDGRPPTDAAAMIREKLGEARLVGLGESRHDTREQVRFKSLLVRELVEGSGFRALILEESYPHALALDRYVTTGEGDPRTLMNGLAGWYVWDTEEMLALVQWIREHNRALEPQQQVRFFGADITAPGPGTREVLVKLAEAGADISLNEQMLGLGLHAGDMWPEILGRYQTLSEGQRETITASYDALVAAVKTEKARLSAMLSEKGYQRLLLLAEIGRKGNAFFLSDGPVSGGVIREAGMAETTLWILDQEIPGEKAILWAHNLHVARGSFRMPEMAEETLEPMGVALGKALGEDYVAVGAAFGGGSYPADLPPGEQVFDRLSLAVMDGALARLPATNFLLDLRDAAPGSAAARWLARERAWRAQGPDALLVPSASFDLVFFVADISRAQPTPLALERFRALDEQSGAQRD